MTYLTPRRPAALATIDFDRVLDDFFRGFGAHAAAAEEIAQWIPQVDVRHGEDSVEIRADLPGMDKDGIEILIENDRLTLRGERKIETGEGESRAERIAGRFERRFRFGNEVDATAARANYENGVLTITLPKREESKPRRLDVK